MLLKERTIESIEDIIKLYPKTLNVNDPDVIKAGNYYLPYSTGFEIECFQHENYQLSNFTSIPNIMEVNNSKSEQRFRIPSGIKGIICLYDIAYQLEFNMIRTNSGIHYHVDCTDMWDKISHNNGELFSSNREPILEALDTWNYKGTYNHRNSNWIRMNHQFKTLEIRIGEMTFNYKLLLKRIIHCNSIIRDLKVKIETEYIRTNSPILLYDKDVSTTLNNRVKKI